MYAQQSSSLQSASGFAFHSSCAASQPSFGAFARVGDWSRRTPVIQQSSSSERANERLDLGDREVEVGLALPELLAVRRRQLLGARALEHLDLRVVALLDLAPELVRLREEVVGVDREDARLRLDAEEQVEQHGLLLLERAGERDLVAEALDQRGDQLVRRELFGARRERGDVVVGVASRSIISAEAYQDCYNTS